MSVPDREQLVVRNVLDGIARLGYSVTPAESPADEPVKRSPSLGSFATTVMAHMARGGLLFGQRQGYWSPDIDGDIEPMKDPETLDSVWWFLTWLEREVKQIRSVRAVAVETEETPT